MPGGRYPWAVRAGGPLLGGGEEEVQTLAWAASDELTALTTGTAKVTFRVPYDFLLSDLRSSLTVAPLGSSQITDINQNGVSILSTKASVDDGKLESKSSTAPVVISTTQLLDNAQMTVDVDQIGSSTAGAGLKVYLIGTPNTAPPPTGEVPEQIPGLAAWWDASDASSFSLTGQTVDTWTDRSGAGQILDQTTLARPIRTVDGAFDAVEYSSLENLIGTFSDLGNAGEDTVFIVARTKALAGAEQVTDWTDNTNNIFMPRFGTSSSNKTINHAGTESTVMNLPAHNLNRYAIVARCGPLNNSDLRDHLANEVTDIVTSGLSGGTTKLTTGSAGSGIQPFNGYLFEMAFWPRRLTDQERQSLLDYAVTKWGL